MDKRKVQVIKGIAISIVCAFHIFTSNRLFEIEFYSWPFSKEVFLLISHRLKWIVAIFVFCTGYGMTLQMTKQNPGKGKEYVRYTILRYLRIMQPYWFVYFVVITSFVLIPSTAIADIYMEDSIFKCIVSDIFLLKPFLHTPRLCNTWWYMLLAVKLILAVPFIYGMLKYFGIILSTGFLIVILNWVNFNPQNDTLWIYLFALYFGCIFSKYQLFEKLKNISPDKKINWLTGVIGSILFIGGIWLRYRYQRTSLIEGSIATGFCMVVVSIPRIPGISKGFEIIGKHSTNIFLIHTVIKNYWLKDLIYGTTNVWIMWILNLSTALACSILFEYIKKKIGYIKLFEKIEAKM